MKETMRILFLLLMSLMITACGKARKVKIPKKKSARVSKSRVAKAGKVLTGTVIATGAYVVTSEVLKQSFDTAAEGEPIQAEFKNSTTMPARLEFTNDGKNWGVKTIDPHEVFSFNSSNKGLIGVKCNDQYVKIDHSNYFTINNNGGTINIYGH